jgi:hypothetical protein
MGLLDDAIHEHLEFKRRGGADPSEVLRLEREAFGPAPGDESAEPAGDFEELRAARIGHAAGGSGAEEVKRAPDPSGHLSQETVELDMRAVLEAEKVSTDDSFEWEMPASRRGFSGRPFEDEPAPRRKIADTRAAEPVEVPAGIPDSPRGVSDRESLRRDRPASPDPDFDFSR